MRGRDHRLWLVLLLVLSGCAQTKPACPSIPQYQPSQVVTQGEAGATRTTTYQTTATIAQVLDFYETHLTERGWEKRERDADGILYGYISADDVAPFQIIVRAIPAAASATAERTYEAELTIAGPFAGFSRTCTTLWP